MSVISVKFPKDCANKEAAIKFKKKLFIYILMSTLSLALLSLICLVYLNIHHPKPPHFSLNHPNITSTAAPIHLTLLSTNPNNNAGIFYDQLQLHASHHNGRNITPNTPIPSFFQEHDETTLLSALLTRHDQHDDDPSARKGLDFKLRGTLRWKVWNYWVSGRYEFNVVCATIFPFGKKGAACSTYV